jgi:hypothetical protein
MKKAFTFLVVIVVTELIPVSCGLWCNSSMCECDDFSSIKNFEIVALKMETSTQTRTNVDTSLVYSTNDVLKTFFIAEKRDVALLTFPNSGFGKAAYACSPLEPHAVQFIDKIEILSKVDVFWNNDQDPILSGQDITNRFKIGHYSSSHYQPINSFISNLKIYYYDRFGLRLAEIPYQETRLVFDVFITLSDGKKFDFKDEVLKVR